MICNTGCPESLGTNQQSKPTPIRAVPVARVNGQLRDLAPGMVIPKSFLEPTLPEGAVQDVGLDAQGRLVGPGGVVLDVGAAQARVDGEVWVTDPVFGGPLDGTWDVAFNLARMAVPTGGVFVVPSGNFQLSTKFVYDKLRTEFRCAGLISPSDDFSSSDGFLIEFKNTTPGGDPLVPDLGLKCDIYGLKVDCRFISQGVKFTQLYNSSVSGLSIWKHYGTGLAIDYSFENSWFGTLVSGGKRKQRQFVQSAAAWSGATSYSVGQFVFVQYPAWQSATTYPADGFVSYNGKSYRSLFSNNLNKTPGVDFVFWQEVPTEYFECLIANTNKDPHDAANYTTSATNPSNRYWRYVYVEHAAVEVINTVSNETVDHQYFYGLDIRHNDNKHLIIVDNIANERKAVNVEFYGLQCHAITPSYLSAYASTSGQSAPDGSHLIVLGHTQRCKFYGANARSASGQSVTHISVGAKCPGKLTEALRIDAANFSGEGSGNYGVSVMPSTAGAVVNFNSEFSFTSASTSPRQADPQSKLVSYAVARDMQSAATPASFTATHLFKIIDASGNSYFVPARSSGW